MPILKNVLGLDLGSHSIKAVEFQQTLRGLVALQLRSLPRADDESPLPEQLQHLVRLHRLSTEHVVCALASDRVSTRRRSFPFRERRKLAQAVPFEVESDLPFDLDDYLIDWELVGGDRRRAEVAATIAARADVSALLAQLDTAGCSPRTLEAEGLVLGNLASLFDLPGTRLLVDLGHRKTTLCLLLQGHAVSARSVPVAGQALTRALARDRGLTPAEAERVKCEEGIFHPALGVGGRETGAVLDRLAREIALTLASLDPLLVAGGERVGELTLFGGSARLDRIDTWLGERIGIPAQRLGLPIEGHAAGLAAGGDPVLFAPAIALALRGTARARTQSNFRQDEFAVRLDLGRYRRDFRWTAWLAAAALLLAVASSGAVTGLESRRAAAIEAQIARLHAEAFPGGPAPANALASLREAVRSANERAEFLGVYRGNLSALDLLTEISRLVPADLDIVFEELTIDHQTVRMRVNGKSFEAADRLGAELAKFTPFAQTRIGSIETDRKTDGKRFDVTISLAAAEERG